MKIIGFDHNKDTVYEWATAVYSNRRAFKYYAGLGVHWYGGVNAPAMNATHHLEPDKFLIATEACNCPDVALAHEATPLHPPHTPPSYTPPLHLASQRPATMSGWVDELLECAKAALSPGAATPLAGPAAHGALLLLSCLLRVASADGVFDAAYEAAAATVGAVLPNRRAPPEVHRAALKLLPAMAAARPSKILHDEEKLAEALRHIELSVREPRYRPDAYVAKAALLRLLDAAAIRQQLPLLVPSIKEAMLKARTSRVFVVEALPALGLLAAAVGEDLFLHNEQMLSALLTLPLSPELAAAFTLISRAIPSLSVRVQERQLELISLHLAHMPFRQACEHAPPTIAAALHRQPPPLQLPPPSQRHGLEQWPRPGGAAAAAAAAAAAGPSAPTLADGSSTRDGIAAAAEVGPPGAPGGTLVTGGAGGGAKHAASCPNLVRAASAGCAPMAAPSPGSGPSSPESPTEGDASVRRGRLFHSGGVGGAPAWGGGHPACEGCRGSSGGRRALSPVALAHGGGGGRRSEDARRAGPQEARLLQRAPRLAPQAQDGAIAARRLRCRRRPILRREARGERLPPRRRFGVELAAECG